MSERHLRASDAHIRWVIDRLAEDENGVNYLDPVLRGRLMDAHAEIIAAIPAPDDHPSPEYEVWVTHDDSDEPQDVFLRESAAAHRVLGDEDAGYYLTYSRYVMRKEEDA